MPDQPTSSAAKSLLFQLESTCPLDLDQIDQAAQAISALDGLPDELCLLTSRLCEKAPVRLDVPFDVSVQEWERQEAHVSAAATFRATAASYLGLLLALCDKQTPLLEWEVLQDAFVAVARLSDPTDAYSSPLIARYAFRLLRQLTAATPRAPHLLTQILNGRLRAWFARSAPAHVHPATGRRLAKARPTAHVWDPDLEWKQVLGSENVLQACLQLLQRTDIESSWQLVVPPLVSLLDDHQFQYRKKGLQALSVLLDKSDASFLKRTSLDALVQHSLKTSLTYLSETSYAPLVEEAMRVSLQLVDLMHPPPATPIDLTSARFEALSQLTLQGPLQIYLFTSEKPVFVTLAGDATVALTQRMGTGMLRHFKDLMGALLAILTFPLLVVDGRSIDMYCQTAEAIRVLLEACPPSRPRWRMLVLTSVAKCWILLKEAQVPKGNQSLLERFQQALQRILTVLAQSDRSDYEHDLAAVKAEAPDELAEL